MPTSKELGKFQSCGVKVIWNHEAQDFTPWLAEEENITLLGDALGLELEVESIEAAVGPYSADILAKDTGTGKYVVIENQLGKTNHDHLGKLITYGSFLNASAVVWIASEYTEEHQRALDWLNDNTGDDLGFYGVLLEVWKIDDSKPAVRLNLISRPAGIKPIDIIKPDNLTEARQLQLDFWQAFRERLLEKKVVASAQKARPQYWMDVPLGRSNIHLSNIVNTYNNVIGIRVYISHKMADQCVSQLEAQKGEIEKELGAKLLWNPNPDNKHKIIALNKKVDLDNKAKWKDYVEWMVDNVAKFRKVFTPRIKKLKLQ